MPKFNRVVVHSEDEAWHHFEPVFDALAKLDVFPHLVFFLIDPVQRGFAKIIGGIDNSTMFWESYEDAQKWRKKLIKITKVLSFEVCATLLVDDTGIAVRPKEKDV